MFDWLPVSSVSIDTHTIGQLVDVVNNLFFHKALVKQLVLLNFEVDKVAGHLDIYQDVCSKAQHVDVLINESLLQVRSQSNELLYESSTGCKSWSQIAHEIFNAYNTHFCEVLHE